MIRTVQEIFRRNCEHAGNINDHLPLLHWLSTESEGVTEFGVDKGVAASALIAGQELRKSNMQNGWYRGYDVNKLCGNYLKRFKNCLVRSDIEIEFVNKSTTTIQPIEPTDLLLIDTEHNEDTIRKELMLHAVSVRKWIVLHDTVTFGEEGENKSGFGILFGIEDLLTDDWQLKYDSPRNNGLAVFERVKK